MPICKACGYAEFTRQHVISCVEPVTKNVTKAVDVTKSVTAEAHDCPICGHHHRRPQTGAERVRAHRKRKKA